VRETLPTGRGVVAVSGGADSVALLRALHDLNADLTVAHVNHQLRGEESDADEALVEALAKNLNLPFVATRITLPAVNVEAAARRMRYEWLQSLEGDWIATGHTADDQAETVLHRIIRGTGIAGLRGIRAEYAPTQRPPLARGGLSVIRPLLNVTRAHVIDYLNSINQNYCIDTSNADPRYTRNRIRHELIPLLKTFNPKVVNALNALSCQADAYERHILYFAREKLEELELPRAGATLIFKGRDLDQFTPSLLRRELLRLAWLREGWPTGDMTFKHWQRLGRLTQGDYPGGIRLVSAPPVVRIGPRSPV